MNGKKEKDRPVLLKAEVHRELKMLSVMSSMQVQHLANLLLQEVLKDKERIRVMILENQDEQVGD